MYEIYIPVTAEVCFHRETLPFTDEEIEIIADGQEHTVDGLQKRWRDFEREMLSQNPNDHDGIKIKWLGGAFCQEIESMWKDDECIYQV